jgi:cation:H+ antiporter
MVVGTLVGSNIINILAIMGVAALASPEPIDVSGRSLVVDLPVMVAAAFLLVAFTWLRRPIRRRTGIVFVAIYAAYVAVLYATN